MIRRILALALMAALLAVPVAWAMNAFYSSGTAGISVTDANTNTAFTDNHSGGTSAAFSATVVLVRSRSTSASACFFDLGDGVATTADHRLAPGESIEMVFDPKRTGGEGWARIGMICGAAGTATFDVTAAR